MKEEINNILRPSPTGIGTYNTDFLSVKQFADIFEEINQDFEMINLQKQKAKTITFRQQRMMRSTDVAGFNKNYMDNITRILGKFTELILLIFNEINLLFSIDHEQAEKLDSQIKYIQRSSKIYRQQIIQTNYDTVRNAIGIKNNIEKVYIPKDAFKTFDINISDDRKKYRDLKKKKYVW